MIEAMACGTPVLAFRNGSVPEVIDEGITGYIVDTIDEGIWGGVLALDRGRVRRRFEERYTATRMAHDYVKIETRSARATPPRSTHEPRCGAERASPTCQQQGRYLF